jgi:phosphate-selective porin OprO and OprP
MTPRRRARACGWLLGVGIFVDCPHVVAQGPRRPPAGSAQVGLALASDSAETPCETGPAPLGEVPPCVPSIVTDLHDLPLFGMKDGILYLRDPHDLIRLYPHARIDLDGQGFLGSHVNELPASEAGVDLSPRFFVRRARLEMGGEVLLRTTFDVGLDLVANPAIDGARADGNRTVVALADAWGELEAGRGLRLMGGVFPAPFSLENRTATSDLAMRERNIAIRGFVVPGGPVLGAALGGASWRKVFEWSGGVFAAETTSPGDFVPSFAATGRVTWRPWGARDSSALQGLKIGASTRFGSRNRRDAQDDAPAIVTGQGFAMWRPTRIDGEGRLLHVIPTSTQWATGVEASLQLPGWGFRGEAYYVSRDTYEALDGAPAVDVRDGNVHGIGWYLEASWWPLTSFGLVDSASAAWGEYPHVKHLELAHLAPQPDLEGFEVALLAAGVDAAYDPASDSGLPDPAAPRSPIEVLQFGWAINFWRTNNFRISVDGNVYVAPSSGGPHNLAVVPGTLRSIIPVDSSARTLCEIGARTTFLF